MSIKPTLWVLDGRLLVDAQRAAQAVEKSVLSTLITAFNHVGASVPVSQDQNRWLKLQQQDRTALPPYISSLTNLALAATRPRVFSGFGGYGRELLEEDLAAKFLSDLRITRGVMTKNQRRLVRRIGIYQKRYENTVGNRNWFHLIVPDIATCVAIAATTGKVDLNYAIAPDCRIIGKIQFQENCRVVLISNRADFLAEAVNEREVARLVVGTKPVSSGQQNITPVSGMPSLIRSMQLDVWPEPQATASVLPFKLQNSLIKNRKAALG